MSDERTASTFTWLNSHLRNRMKVPTLVRTTQIRNWYIEERRARAEARIQTTTLVLLA